ncbi:hypothetical protein [Winogradskyella sp.]|jgi:hypothetical protein|uniref:hypothetical protein n=1 Tax=Winogradskyella sp. TaxID=1883156 RepID=UPI0025F4C514|nr:hypothetical protein [Winogradskyella sp.]MCT4630190.1 hypothetical protein [Winogradskyella sp.]
MRYKNLVFEVVLPLIFSVIGVYFLSKNVSDITILDAIFNSTSNTILSTLSILVGFTLTLITVIISTDKLAKIKEYMTHYKIDGKQITLYKYLLINLSYTALIEFFLISFNILFISFGHSFAMTTIYLCMLFNAFLCVHLLFISIRSFTDLYNIIIGTSD